MRNLSLTLNRLLRTGQSSPPHPEPNRVPAFSGAIAAAENSENFAGSGYLGPDSSVYTVECDFWAEN